jgi:ADP-ribosylglycohydrolase
LEAVIWCFLRTNNYKEAVLKAINLWWDTDTIWALTWWLAWIYYGYKSIPKEWENDLLKKDYLEELIGKFEAFLK